MTDLRTQLQTAIAAGYNPQSMATVFETLQRVSKLEGATPGGKLQTHDGAFKRTINTFSDLTDKARLDVEPYKVELVKLDQEMSMTEFNQKCPSPYQSSAWRW